MGAEPSSRPFARNTGAIITGTNKIGNLGIGIDNGPPNGYGSTGIPWWNGPNETGGWIIAQEVPANNQPTPVPPSVTASVGFWRSEARTELSFLDLAKYISKIAGNTQTFPSGMAARVWLTDNGYWTNYRVTGTVTVYNTHPTVSINDLGFSADFGATFITKFNIPYVGSLPVGPGQSATLTSSYTAAIPCFSGNTSIYFSSSVGSTGTIYTTSPCITIGPSSNENIPVGFRGPGGSGFGMPNDTSWVDIYISP